VRTLEFNIDERPIINMLPLITAKPLIFACNVGTDAFAEGKLQMSDRFLEHVKVKYPGIPCVVLSSLLEQEILQIRAEEGEEEAREYMEISGI